MTISSDQEFKDTKQIMLGNKEMNPDFRGIADWIDNYFSVKTVNIIYDVVANLKGPRINICFEFKEDAKKFYGNSGLNYDYNKQRQIAEKFKEHIEKQGLDKKGDLFNLFSTKKYLTNDVFVCYSAFEPIAKAEAVGDIPDNKIQTLKHELNDTNLWEISSYSSAVTFFLFTDDQLKQYEKSGIAKSWQDKFFNILKEYDTFNYFKASDFRIYLDSKENFDANFQSNWYYYYK